MHDQDIWAVAHDYQSLTGEELKNRLEVFDGLRGMNLERFKRATPKDWQKLDFHPKIGAMTLRNLLELYANHVECYIWQNLNLA